MGASAGSTASDNGGMTGYGGFGGLGIGNPGSYGGQSSVGAPGGTGGAAGSDTSGGWGGYSADQIAEAMAQSDEQAKQNNAERSLADLGYNSNEIGNIMNSINNLSVNEASRAYDTLTDIAIKEDFKERSFLDKISSLYTQKKVGGDLGLYGEAIAEDLAESVLGFSASKIAAVFTGPFGKKIGDMLSSYAANKARDNFVENVSKFGVDKAKEIAREEVDLHTKEYGYSGNPKEIIDTINKNIALQGGSAMGFWDDIIGETAADAARGAAGTSAAYQQQALDYLKERDIVPKVFSEGATKRLGGFYGLEGGEEGAMDAYKESPIYANLMAGRGLGEEAILRNAAMTGGLRSGNVQEALYDYNVMAEQDALNRYMAGLGGFTGLSGYAPQVAGTMTGIGQTLAQGQLGAAQAQQQGTANLIGIGGAAYEALGGARGIWDIGKSAVKGIGNVISSIF